MASIQSSNVSMRQAGGVFQSLKEASALSMWWCRFQGLLGGTLLISILSYCTIVRGIGDPPFLIGDEVVHVANARSYSANKAVVHNHPPLGTLLLTLGGACIGGNAESLSLTHVRLASALAGVATSLLLYWCLFLMTRKQLYAVCFSVIYCLNNAFIVQARLAVLDIFQLLFVVLSILLFLLMQSCMQAQKGSSGRLALLSVGLGATIAAATCVKLSGLITLVFPTIVLYQNRYRVSRLRGLLFMGTGFLMTVFLVYQVHFSHGAPREQSLLTGIVDQIRYGLHFHSRARPLTEGIGENGSMPFDWIIGSGAILYHQRMDSSGAHEALLFQPNYSTWLVALLGVLAALLLPRHVFCEKRVSQNLSTSRALLGLYVLYMLVMSCIPRVLYLYHYLLPLTSGILLCALYCSMIPPRYERVLVRILLLLTVVSFFNYRFLSSTTYL